VNKQLPLNAVWIHKINYQQYENIPMSCIHFNFNISSESWVMFVF